MQRKFIFTTTNVPVYIGDTVKISVNSTDGTGTYKTVDVYKLTEDNVDVFIRNGIIKEVQYSYRNPDKLEYYINKLAENTGTTYKETTDKVAELTLLYPAAAASLMLRVIAETFDEQYPDHISKSPSIWVISTINWKPQILDKKSIIDYSSFAAFRKREDAEKAIRIIEPILYEP